MGIGGTFPFLIDPRRLFQKQDLGGRLQVRAESQQTAIAILDHELAAVPGHVAKSASEFHAVGGVLGIKKEGPGKPGPYKTLEEEYGLAR